MSTIPDTEFIPSTHYLFGPLDGMVNQKKVFLKGRLAT